jgi:preprotein translocase subunit SecY
VVNQTTPIHLLIYGAMIVGFAYFYNAIPRPGQAGRQLRKQGGFIPHPPGPQTERYLSKTLNRLTLPAPSSSPSSPSCPRSCWRWATCRLPFGGTSVLIAVGVALETMKQITASSCCATTGLPG